MHDKSEASFEEDLAAMDPPQPAGGMTDLEYHAHPAFNQSTACRLVNESPRHAFEYRRVQKLRQGHEDPKHTREREIGTVTHKLVLGSTTGFHEINHDDYRKKGAQEWRSDCERQSITPILSCDLDKARRAATAIREQLAEEFGIELDGESERVIIWDHDLRNNGAVLQCKAKLDHVRRDGLTIIDVKTGQDANPKQLVRRILDQGYHVQAACYVEALESTERYKIGRVTFIDAFIETEGLAMCVPVEIAGGLLELGQRAWDGSCFTWHHCQQEGFYPGYTQSILRPEAPPWALQQEMARDE